MEQNNQQTIEWIDVELAELAKHPSNTSFEKLPALQLEEQKITTITVDFLKPFSVWEDRETGVVKKIIPVLHNNERKVFWLNVRNPVYREIVEAGKKGQNVFKILRTGQQKNTKYAIIRE